MTSSLPKEKMGRDGKREGGRGREYLVDGGASVPVPPSPPSPLAVPFACGRINKNGRKRPPTTRDFGSGTRHSPPPLRGEKGIKIMLLAKVWEPSAQMKVSEQGTVDSPRDDSDRR